MGPTVMSFEHQLPQSDAPSEVGLTRLKITSIRDFCGPHHVQKWRGAVHHSNIQNHFWGPFERFFHDQNRPSCVSHLNVILDHFSGGIHISGGAHQVLLHVFACILMFSDGMAHLITVDGVDLRTESRWSPPQLDLRTTAVRSSS